MFQSHLLGGQLMSYGTLLNGTIPMNADTEMFAYKFYPRSTLPITAVDLLLDENGDTSGVTFAIEVQTDNADIPSGTVLGAATPGFSFSADGWTGLQTLAANTGNLTINVPVWVVIKRTAGTLDGTNFIQTRGPASVSAACIILNARYRHYDGTNWTNTAAQISRASFVVKQTDGVTTLYNGIPITDNQATPTAPDIFDSNKQGLRFTVGSKCTIQGVAFSASKTGTPTDLKFRLFEGATERTSVTVPAASIVTNITNHVWFATPYTVGAGSTCYLVAVQTGTDETDGGDGSNDYRITVTKIPTADYLRAAFSADFASVYGTSTDPTALTVLNTEIPTLCPIILDTETDLSCGAGGGSFVFSS